MAKKKLLFIFNPHAGKGQIRLKLLDIIDTFVKNDFQVVIHPTQASNEARKMITEEAEDYDRIVCAGGDGTLEEVVSGMMKREQKRMIGYIPAGSTNDFANSLYLPKDMLRSAEIAIKGKSFPCDVGNMNGKFFVYIAAFGLFTDVSYGTPQEWKNLLGHMAYLLEGAKSLTSIKSYSMRVECIDETENSTGLQIGENTENDADLQRKDNKDVIEGEFIYGMITNSTSVGGFKNMTGSNVQLDDGLFEVTFIKKPKNPMELREILRSLTNLKDDTDLIYSAKTSEIHIVSEKEVAWTMDGEYGGSHTDVLIKNEKRAIEIMVEDIPEKNLPVIEKTVDNVEIEPEEITKLAGKDENSKKNIQKPQEFVVI